MSYGFVFIIGWIDDDLGRIVCDVTNRESAKLGVMNVMRFN